ncbi:MAG: tetratricopeptide repeat protein [Deltaproteobacteria bacterium]|nr:tetratricopeptide repeat protein [Deltaproteobacteria bacterium]
MLSALVGAWCLRSSFAPAGRDLLPLVSALGLALAVPSATARGATGRELAVSLCLRLAPATLATVFVHHVFVDGRGAELGDWALAAAGLALGLAARSTTARATTGLLAVSLLAMPRLLLELPPALARRAAASAAGLSAGDAELGEVMARGRATASANVGALGGAMVWPLRDRVVVEFDGTLSGASARARAAESLAGVLAGCASSGRARLVVTGDELGLVAAAARDQGFSGIDVAAIAPVFADVAALDAGARRTWLAASTRLLRVPGPALLRLGDQASAVVIVQRAGHTSGAGTFPDAAGLAAAHRLAPGGATVLQLPALGLDPAVLSEAIASFANEFHVATLWLPPEGGEQALLVGTDGPINWSSMLQCASASRPFLAGRGLAGAEDLAGLVAADGEWLRGLAPRRAAGWSRSPAVSGSEALTLGRLGLDAAPPPRPWSDDAPVDEILRRRDGRRAALAVLEASVQGNVAAALEQARALADDPAAQAALEPLVAPMLERARASATSASREGVDSPHWAEAENAIQAALLLHPGSAAAHCARGEVAFARKRLDDAREAYESCAAKAPERLEAWEGIARSRRIDGDLAGAEAALRTALTLAPGRLQPALHLGIVLTDLGRSAEAEHWLRRAVTLAAEAEPSDRARVHLALARALVVSGRAPAALPEARRADLDAPSADSAYWLGAAQYALGATAEAEASFRVAIGRDPRHTGAINDLGSCLAGRGAYAEAAQSFREVLLIEPENRAATMNLSRLRSFAAGDGAPPVPVPGAPPQ